MNSVSYTGGSQTGYMVHRSCRITAVAVTLLVVLASALAASGPPAAPGQWPPYVTMRDETSMYVRWRTAEPSRDTLVLSEEGSSNELGTFSEDTPSRRHNLLLRDLRPGVLYRYNIRGGNNSGMEGRLRVPRQGRESAFFVLGDTQALSIPGTLTMELTRQKMVVEAMARDASSVDFLVHTGDLVESGAIPEYDNFFPMVAPLTARMPIFAVMGNHDDRTEVFADTFSFPGEGKLSGVNWRYFSTENALFIFLNLNFNSIKQVSQTTAWLTTVLEQFSDRKWKFVFTHQPMYSSVERDSDTPLRKLFESLFLKHGIDVVFSGHHHAYQRILRNGIMYVVSGGGGGRGYSPLMNPPVDGTIRTAERTMHYLCGRISRDRFVFDARRVGLESATENVERSEGEMDHFELSKP